MFDSSGRFLLERYAAYNSAGGMGLARALGTDGSGAEDPLGSFAARDFSVVGTRRVCGMSLFSRSKGRADGEAEIGHSASMISMARSSARLSVPCHSWMRVRIHSSITPFDASL